MEVIRVVNSSQNNGHFQFTVQVQGKASRAYAPANKISGFFSKKINILYKLQYKQRRKNILQLFQVILQFCFILQVRRKNIKEL